MYNVHCTLHIVYFAIYTMHCSLYKARANELAALSLPFRDGGSLPDQSLCQSLYCTALQCTTLHCTELFCIALHYTVLHWNETYCTALHFIALHYNGLHCTTMQSPLYCNALQYKVHCTAMDSVEIWGDIWCWVFREQGGDYHLVKTNLIASLQTSAGPHFQKWGSFPNEIISKVAPLKPL